MRTRGGLWPRAARPDASRRACSMLDTRGAGAAAAGRHVTLIAGRQEHGSESGQRPRPRVSATASTIPPGSRSEALDRPRQGLDRLDRQSLDLLRHRASTQRFNRNSASRRHTSHRAGAEPAARPLRCVETSPWAASTGNYLACALGPGRRAGGCRAPCVNPYRYPCAALQRRHAVPTPF